MPFYVMCNLHPTHGRSNEMLIQLVVSIDAFLTFKVIFTLMEYVPIIPPLSHYVIDICFVLFKRKEVMPAVVEFCICIQNTN